MRCYANHGLMLGPLGYKDKWNIPKEVCILGIRSMSKQGCKLCTGCLGWVLDWRHSMYPYYLGYSLFKGDDLKAIFEYSHVLTHAG